MKCPNCERTTGVFALRCRVCHQRLPCWYISAILLTITAIVGIIVLLERL